MKWIKEVTQFTVIIQRRFEKHKKFVGRKHIGQRYCQPKRIIPISLNNCPLVRLKTLRIYNNET